MRRNAKPSSSSPPREALAVLVERVTFHNPGNGFCVLRVRARGHRDLVTTVGHAASIFAGEWVNHHIRGRRLVVLVGQRKAIAIAVRNVSGHRYSASCQGSPRNREIPLPSEKFDRRTADPASAFSPGPRRPHPHSDAAQREVPAL